MPCGCVVSKSENWGCQPAQFFVLAFLRRHAREVSRTRPEHTTERTNTRCLPCSCQDWNTITFAAKAGPTPGKAAAATLKEAQRKGEVLAERKVTHQATASGKSAKALDDETEELKHAKVPTELRKALSQARAAKGLTQKQLAAQRKPPVAVSLITE